MVLGVPYRTIFCKTDLFVILMLLCFNEMITRRPTAKVLLESPYFPASIKSSYLFVSPLQLLVQDSSRLQYLANLAKQGALKAMGTFAAEKSASYCLPLLVTPPSDIEAEWACTLLEEFIKSLKPSAVNTLIFPCIQKILQARYEICLQFLTLPLTCAFDSLIVLILISDNRLFSSKSVPSPRFFCEKNLESGW